MGRTITYALWNFYFRITKPSKSAKGTVVKRGTTNEWSQIPQVLWIEIMEYTSYPRMDKYLVQIFGLGGIENYVHPDFSTEAPFLRGEGGICAACFRRRQEEEEPNPGGHPHWGWQSKQQCPERCREWLAWKGWRKVQRWSLEERSERMRRASERRERTDRDWIKGRAQIEWWSLMKIKIREQKRLSQNERRERRRLTKEQKESWKHMCNHTHNHASHPGKTQVSEHTQEIERKREREGLCK